MGLIFDNVDLEQEFGVIIDGASSWPKPERDVSYIHVPGRSGDILMDNGCWKNVNISYNFLIKDYWKTAFEDFAAWLCSHVGYFRLEDPVRHPGVYRMASFTGPLDPDLWFTTDTGVFAVEFNCKPQQWLTSGEMKVFPIYTGMISARASGSNVELVDDTLQHRVTTLYPIPSGSGQLNGDFQVYLEEPFSGEDITVTAAVLPYDANKNVINTDTLAPIYQTFTFTSNDEEGDGHTLYFTIENETNLAYFRFYVGTEDERTLQIFNAMGHINRGTQVNDVTAPLLWIDCPLENPTLFTSDPNITMAVDGEVAINDYTVTLTGATYPVVVDCEMETCYHNDNGTLVNMNEFATITNSDPKEFKDFPYLKPGTNIISMGEHTLDAVYSETEPGTISIQPNWYRI